MAKKEKEFLTTLKHSVKMRGAFFHKIGDAPHLGGGVRFDLEKPFDAFMSWVGIPVAIEAKYMPEYRAFGISSLRPCQVKGLDEARAAGMAAFVLLNIRAKGEFTRMIWFDWGYWKSIWMERGNCTKQEILSRPYIQGIRVTTRLHEKTQKPIRETRFDLSAFFQAVEDSRRLCVRTQPNPCFSQDASTRP